MTNNDLEKVQGIIGYEFNNLYLLKQAFTRRSYSIENGGENNEVLEFIGDKALDMVVIKTLMENFAYEEEECFKTKYDEGMYTEIKKNLVEGKALAKAMDKLGFNEYLLMSNGDIKNHIEEQDSVKEDLLEAIIGAVAVDCNYNMDTLEYVVKNLIDFEKEFIIEDDSNVSYYQELSKYLKDNCYPKAKHKFIETNTGYSCELTTECSARIFFGKGKTKELALNKASRDAILFINNQFNRYCEIEEFIPNPNYDESVNQLEMLHQKDYITKPIYEYDQRIREDGTSEWKCRCKLKEYQLPWTYIANTKKDAKKGAALSMVHYIIADEDIRMSDEPTDNDDFIF